MNVRNVNVYINLHRYRVPFSNSNMAGSLSIEIFVTCKLAIHKSELRRIITFINDTLKKFILTLFTKTQKNIMLRKDSNLTLQLILDIY